jgi:putative ABC transport system substrate-binding protein
MYREAGGQIARILKGAKPSEIPVMQSVRFELLLNVKTARKLGLSVPPTFLASVDEVVE